MRIGVDATSTQNSRGYGRHARALLNALVRLDARNDYTFFMDANWASGTLPSGAQVRWVQTDVPAATAASANGRRSVLDMVRMSRAMSDWSFDLLFFPTIYTYVPVLSPAKKVVMIHDVIAETYPQLTLPSLPAKLFWRSKVAAGRWQADAIVTVSDFSRQGILKHFKIDPDRVFVIGEASDPIFCVLPDPKPTPRLCGLDLARHGRLIVYVGGFSPHKNLETLVSAFAKLAAQSRFSDLRLVLVGEDKKEVFHSYSGTIKRQVEALGLADRVIFTGYLPDEELVVLLNLATVLALPSLIEGFGLPAVEAAACGCPVVATNVSPLPALLGEGGVFIDPTVQEELEAALSQVIESASLRDHMRKAGQAAAGKLTWEGAARQMMDLMLQVVMR
jgi:glycosyltransferase involved in cell wall biosynthesis